MFVVQICSLSDFELLIYVFLVLKSRCESIGIATRPFIILSIKERQCSRLLLEHIGHVVRMHGNNSTIETKQSNVGFWIQMLMVQTPASVCCVLEQDTLSALLQSTQL